MTAPRPYPGALLSEAEAAAYLAVSRTTLRQLVEAGTVPAPVRVPGLDRRLYRRDELDAWARSLEPVEATAPANPWG